MKTVCKLSIHGFLACWIVGIVCCPKGFAISTRFTNLDDMTIFHTIVRNGSFSTNDYELLKLRAHTFSDSIVIREFGLKTALDAACYFGRADICNMILKEDCRIDWDGLPRGEMKMTCLDAAFQSVLNGNSEMQGVLSNLVERHPSTSRWRTMSHGESLLEAFASQWLGTSEMEGSCAVVVYDSSQTKPGQNAPWIRVGTISNGVFQAVSKTMISGRESVPTFPTRFLEDPVIDAIHLLNHEYSVKGYLQQKPSVREFSDHDTICFKTDTENIPNSDDACFYLIRFFEMPYPGKENPVENLVDIVVAKVFPSEYRYWLLPRTHCLSFFVYGIPVFHVFQ